MHCKLTYNDAMRWVKARNISISSCVAVEHRNLVLYCKSMFKDRFGAVIGSTLAAKSVVSGESALHAAAAERQAAQVARPQAGAGARMPAPRIAAPHCNGAASRGSDDYHQLPSQKTCQLCISGICLRLHFI